MPQQPAGAVARLVRNQRLAFGAEGEILAHAIAVDHAVLVVAPYIAFGLLVLFDDLHAGIFGGYEQLQLRPLLRLFERLCGR